MANPFLRRATEYVRDDASFLSIVSPTPLTTFLAKNKHKDDMFEVPVRIIGSPGSGKTMLATLAEFKMVEAILKDPTNPTNRTLAAALAEAGFLQSAIPHVAAVRVMLSVQRQLVSAGCSLPKPELALAREGAPLSQGG